MKKCEFAIKIKNCEEAKLLLRKEILKVCKKDILFAVKIKIKLEILLCNIKLKLLKCFKSLVDK